MLRLLNSATPEPKVSHPLPLAVSTNSEFLTVAIAGYFINYAVEVRRNTSSALGAIYLAVAQGCFAVGRFSGSFAMKFIKPRYVRDTKRKL